MGIDITKRVAAQEALVKSQKRYRRVVENANDGIIITQGDVIVFHNKRAESLTGYSKEELRQIPFMDIVLPFPVSVK